MRSIAWAIAAWLAAAGNAPAQSDSCTLETMESCSKDRLLWLMTYDGLLKDETHSFFGNHAWNREVLRRFPLTELLGALAATRDEHLREQLVVALGDRSENQVARVYRAEMREPPERSDCRMATQLAKRGDRRALALLHRDLARIGRPTRCGFSSLEWAEIAPIFGEQKYYAAVPALIRCLRAASLNLAGGAHQALDMLYPGASPKDVESPAAAYDYYRRRQAMRK